MKIKHYFAVIILVSLCCGFLLEHLISNSQSGITAISNEVISNQFLIDEYERFENDLSQYFITVDLILGSGESYLINGALNKSKLLSKSLAKFRSNPELFKDTRLLDSLGKKLVQENELIKQALAIDSANRDILLDKLLLRSDEITKEMISIVGEINNRINKKADEKIMLLTKKQQSFNTIKVIGPVVFFIVLIALWIWSYKRVSNPLFKLKQSAEKLLTNFTGFESIEKGPKEAVELSMSLAYLTNTLAYQATHDPLTQLYNRREFERKLDKYIAQQGNDSVSKNDVLCYLDLDRFKIVNDTCGHIAGDELLKIVAKEISESVRKSDFVARVGGDEFCILLYRCSRDTALQVCNKIRNNIENIRYEWEDKVFRISASIGVSEIDVSENSAAEILNAADTACSIAKEMGRNRVYTVNSSDTQLAQKRSEMSCVNQIQLAIEENRFILYRQNIVSLGDSVDSRQHFELLIRMVGKDNKHISPFEFLPIAERYYLATKLDQWVVAHAFQVLGSNPVALEDLELCNINLSGQSFNNGMSDYIIDKFIETGMPADKVCFEITETAAVTNIDSAKNFITKLKKFGCKFALDDFGSGLSSFQYLKELPVDFLKIDGSFVKNMANDQFDFATVKAINDIAKTSGKLTVAEFVENADIVNKLKEIGVDFAQGYYFDKPALLEKPLEECKLAS